MAKARPEPKALGLAIEFAEMFPFAFALFWPYRIVSDALFHIGQALLKFEQPAFGEIEVNGGILNSKGHLAQIIRLVLN